MPSFASRFKQLEFSDCDLAIQVRSPDTASGEEPASKRPRTAAHDQPQHAAAFPAHQVILCSSDYFLAQVQNWQTTTGTSEPCSSQQQQVQPNRVTFTLSVSSAEEVPAAEAVIAGLYGVSNSFSSLQHDQLVHALVIADMIDAAEPAGQASRCLRTAARQGLAEAALKALARLSAWPDCLKPLLPVIIANAGCCKLRIQDSAAVLAADPNRLIQHILLSVFGELQAVWRDELLTDMLLQLPCAAMQLLLSSDELQVPSEDIVVYTAQQYVSKQQTAGAKLLTKSALAKLVRAPYLSDLMLQYVVLSHDSSKLLMSSYLKQLSQLVSLRRTVKDQDSELFEEEIVRIHDAPDSWQLAQRRLVPASKAELVWKLPMQELREACKEVHASNNGKDIISRITPPIAGFAFVMSVTLANTNGGVEIDVALGPSRYRVSDGFHLNVQAAISCHGIERTQVFTALTAELWQYVGNFFGIECMAGGWDEAAWAAQGLPTTGDLVLKLEISEVS